MGRIKTKLAKRVATELWEENRASFSRGFAENKKAVEKFAYFPSKKLRNIVAGYTTRLAKRQAKK